MKSGAEGKHGCGQSDGTDWEAFGVVHCVFLFCFIDQNQDGHRQDHSKLHAQRDRAEGMATGLFRELARAPDTHQRQPDAASGEQPLAADADRCLGHPGTARHAVAGAKEIAVKGKVIGNGLGLHHAEEMHAGTRPTSDRHDAVGLAMQGGGRWRAVLGAGADGIAAEIVRQVPADAAFDAQCGRGFDIAQAQTHGTNDISGKTGNDGARATIGLVLAIHGELKRRLVFQLVVPALEPGRADRVMDQVLRLFRQRPRANHAECDLARIEDFAIRLGFVFSLVPRQAQVEQSGIGPVIGDQVRPGEVLRREHGLAESDHHVVCLCRTIRIGPECGVHEADELRLQPDGRRQALGP